MSTRGGNYCAWPAENSVLLVLGPTVFAGLPSSFASHRGLSSGTAGGKYSGSSQWRAKVRGTVRKHVVGISGMKEVFWIFGAYN